jgi:hypothetical protein
MDFCAMWMLNIIRNTALGVFSAPPESVGIEVLAWNQSGAELILRRRKCDRKSWNVSVQVQQGPSFSSVRHVANHFCGGWVRSRPPATRNAVSDLVVIGFLVESVICRRIKIKSDAVNTRGWVTRGGGSRFALECAAQFKYAIDIHHCIGCLALPDLINIYTASWVSFMRCAVCSLGRKWETRRGSNQINLHRNQNDLRLERFNLKFSINSNFIGKFGDIYFPNFCSKFLPCVMQIEVGLEKIIQIRSVD